MTASGAIHAPIPYATTTSAFGYTAVFLGLGFFLVSFVPPFIPGKTMETSFIVAPIAAPCYAVALGIVAFRIAKKIHGGRVAARMRGSSRAAVTSDSAGFSAGWFAMFVVATVVQVAFLVLYERH